MGIKENISLISKIENSKSDESTENKLIGGIKTAKDILKVVKKENPELSEKFQKEYLQLERQILDSIKDDKKFTLIELTKIKLEFSDIVTLADDNDIEGHSNMLGLLGEWITGANKKGIKNDTDLLLKKDIKDYSIQEAKGILEYLNNNYSNFEKGAYAGFDEDNIEDLEDKKDVNIFQERLIKKIIGNKGSDYIFGYNQNKGNFLIKKEEIVNDIQTNNIKNINIKALYEYLKDINKDNFLDVIGNVGIRNLKEYIKTIKGVDGKLNNIKKILNEKGIDIEKVVIDVRNNNKLKNILNINNSNIEEYSRILNNTDSIDGTKKILEKNPEYIKLITNIEVLGEIDTYGKNKRLNLSDLNEVFLNNKENILEIINIIGIQNDILSLNIIDKKLFDDNKFILQLVNIFDEEYTYNILYKYGFKQNKINTLFEYLNNSNKGSLKENNNEINDKINKVLVKEVYNEKNQKKEFDILMDPNTSKEKLLKIRWDVINTYLNTNNDEIPKIIERILNLEETIKKGFEIGIFKKLPTVIEKISSTNKWSEELLQRYPRLFSILEKKDDPMLLIASLNGLNDNKVFSFEIANLLSKFKPNNINDILIVISVISALTSNGKEDEKGKNTVLSILRKGGLMAKFANIIKGKKNIEIERGYTGLFKLYGNLFNSLNEKTQILGKGLTNFDNLKILNNTLNQKNIFELKHIFGKNINIKNITEEFTLYINNPSDLVLSDMINKYNIDKAKIHVFLNLINEKSKGKTQELTLQINKLITSSTNINEEEKIELISKLNDKILSKKEKIKLIDDSKLSKEEKIELISKLKDLQKQNKLQVKTNEKNAKNYVKHLTGKITKEEFYNNLILDESDKNLFEEEIEEIKIERQEKENKINEQETKVSYKESNSTLVINEKYSLNNYTNNPSIIIKGGEDVKISPNQAKMIKSNPEVTEIIITLNTTLIKVGLPNLINYIDPISNAIGTTGGVNNNDKSLESNEIQKFLNNILLSVGETEINTVSLEQYTNEFNQKNNVQVSGNHKNKKEIGSSDIEERFMKKYIIGFTNFQTGKFQNDIQKKS